MLINSWWDERLFLLYERYLTLIRIRSTESIYERYLTLIRTRSTEFIYERYSTNWDVLSELKIKNILSMSLWDCISVWLDKFRGSLNIFLVMILEGSKFKWCKSKEFVENLGKITT